MFNITETQIKSMGISAASVVDVIIEVSDFAGKSYNIRNISPNFNPNLSRDSFIVRAPIGEDVMYEEIINALKESHTDNETEYLPLHNLAIEILKRYKYVFTVSSAALLVHHNYKGGLLYHTYRMVKSANTLCAYIWESGNEIRFWHIGIYSEDRGAFYASYLGRKMNIKKEKIIAWKDMTNNDFVL